MGIIKKFDEFVNEAIIGRPIGGKTDSLKDLYQYLLDNYDNLGDVEINFNEGKDGNGEYWSELQIPVTLSGLMLETEPGVMEGGTFSIDIKPELEQYLEPGTYDEVDDMILDDHGVLRVFTDEESISNDSILGVLDGLLKNVPDPALRKRI